MADLERKMAVAWSRLFQPSMALVLLASLPIGAIATKIAHESGHALAALACGGSIRQIRVMPGVQVYPSLKRAPCRIVSITYTEPPGRWRQGFVAFMGTGFTTLLAYLLLALLWRLRPSRHARASLALIALLMAWDMVLYAVLPLFGLRRFILFGGDHAEPVQAMELMGVPKACFLVALALSFLLFHGLLTRILLRRKDTDTSKPRP
jgi:hypothetical protein